MTGQPYFMQGDSDVGCMSDSVVGYADAVGAMSYPVVGYAEGGDLFVEADDEDVGYYDLVEGDDDLDDDVDTIAGAVSEMFDRAGVQVREWDDDGVVYCEMTIPGPRKIVISARVAAPDEALEVGYGWDDDEVGSRSSRKKRRRKRIKKFFKKSAGAIKNVAKKVAKSKVFKAVAKIAPLVASVIPGGQVLTAGLAVAKTASKLVQRAKKGNGPARAIIKKVANRVRDGRRQGQLRAALKGKLRARLAAGPTKSRRYTVRQGGRTRTVALGA